MSRHRLLLAVVVIVIALVVLAVVRPRTFYPFLLNGHAVVSKFNYGHVIVDASFPEFNRSAVDAGIRELVTTEVFEPLASEAVEHEYAANETDHAVVAYQVPYRTLRYAGIVIDVTIDSEEHPAHYVIVRTVDLWRDRVLTLGDFSVSANDPLRMAADAVQGQLQNQEGIDQKKVFKNLKPTQSILSNFIADHEGLEFYFSPGLLAAPERGVIVVDVPWASVAHDLKP